MCEEMKESLILKDFEELNEFFNPKKEENNAYEDIQDGLLVGKIIVSNNDLKRRIDLFNNSKYNETHEKKYSDILDILTLGQKYLECYLEMNRESIYITMKTVYYNFFKFNVISYILNVRYESWIEENKHFLTHLLETIYQEKEFNETESQHLLLLVFKTEINRKMINMRTFLLKFYLLGGKQEL